MTTETMIPVPGGAVWSDDSGGEGPPLVLLHPGVGDSRFWDLVRPELTSRYRVIRYDARGFGRSPAPTQPFTLFADLLTVLDHYRLDRVAIVGCSQGGGTGLALAVERPERLSALVALCPAIPGHPWAQEAGEGGDAGLEARWNQAIKDGDADALAVIFAAIWAAGDGGLTDAVMEQLRSAARADIAIAGRQQDDPPVWDRLGEITVPSALVAGGADFAPLAESNKQAAERIPGCDFTLVAGMDHLPALRQPALVLDIIASTLARAV
jgi:pimeloyl-ACP methyl ester carboxylesterase